MSLLAKKCGLGRWISFKDKMPPNDKNIIVTDMNAGITVTWWNETRYTKDSGFVLKGDSTHVTRKLSDLTHWMFVSEIMFPHCGDDSCS